MVDCECCLPPLRAVCLGVVKTSDACRGFQRLAGGGAEQEVAPVATAEIRAVLTRSTCEGLPGLLLRISEFSPGREVRRGGDGREDPTDSRHQRLFISPTLRLRSAQRAM